VAGEASKQRVELGVVLEADLRLEDMNIDDEQHNKLYVT
jgi:hypothetical protein